MAAKLDFVELDRVLSEFFSAQGMPDAGYVIVCCNPELRLAITSNVADLDIVKGMLRGATKNVSEIEPVMFDTLPPHQGHA